MNYIKHYNKLISRSKDRIIEGYREKHHIIPRCMDGKDNKENLVNLTPEEHYLAHLLLVKIYPNNTALIFAAAMMVCSGKGQQRNNNKMYGWLRRKHSTAMSDAQSGKRNSQYKTCWIAHLELKESKKIPISEIKIYLSSGWIKKRIMNFDDYFDKIKEREFYENNREQFERNNKGINSSSFIGFWYTPNGKFDSLVSAASENNCCTKTIANRAHSHRFNDYSFEPMLP